VSRGFCIAALVIVLFQQPKLRADAVNPEIEKAKQLVTAGDLKEATSLLRRLISQEPDNPDVHLLLGTALALLRQRSEALQELSRAIELRPQFAPAHYTLGVALSGFGELEAARKAFERAIELDPKFADAHVNLAMILAHDGQFNRAIEHLSKAVQVLEPGPRAANAYYLKGKMYNEQKQLEQARHELDQAIRLQPGFAQAYYELGRTCDKLLDSSCAVHALEKAAELMPGDGGVQYNLGVQYLRAGDGQRALPHLQSANEAMPAERNILYNLALALQKTGREAEAKPLFAKVHEMLEGANSPEAGKLNNEAVELEDRGELRDALEKYRAALELNPLNTTFRRNLGLVLCRLELWQQGVDELQQVLRLDPNDVQATKALYIALEHTSPRK